MVLVDYTIGLRKMRINEKKLSIIIVNYKSGRFLFSSISSIISSSTKTSYEIIVVDNDDKKTISKDLEIKFPHVVYIPNKNKGFGQGNNVGVKVAKGKYLFFLNPDTKVYPGAIDNLVRFLDKNKKTVIVAPLLLDEKNKPYELQGTEILTPFKAVFAYSFLNKFFPKNPISLKFWMKGWDKTKIKNVDVVPGTAFIVRSDVFRKIGGFDEKIFLYFEEYDMCKRVKQLGYGLSIITSAKVVHYWGESTKESDLDIQKVFEQSRFYYFKKYFGLFPAMLVSLILGIKKSNVTFVAILLVGAFMRFNKLADSFSLISDQKWFYTSAAELLAGKIPLVGITSSQTWLHQGPLWTYMLAPVLFFSNFNPVSGAYLTATLGLFSIFMIYIIGKQVNEKVAVVASLIYATSPLVLQSDRFAYHTSPIALVVLVLIYSLVKWVDGKIIYFPIALFAMSLLYNLELATVVFWPVIIVLLIAGLVEREMFVVKLINIKIAILSALFLLIPMISILIYDVNHGFIQTAKYANWIIYHKIIKSILESNFNSHASLQALSFLGKKAIDIMFIRNQLLSLLIVFIALINLPFEFFKSRPKQVIVLSTAIPIVGFVFNGVLSDAYLPMLYPGVILCVALLLDKALNNKIASIIIKNKLLIIILCLGIFLRLYRIEQNFIFSSEIGDNLLAVKNAYFGGYLPLVGPPTSHHWIDFGPLFYWTYGPILVLSKFNPYSYAYFGAFISVLTIIVNYLVLLKLANRRVALISSLLLAVSFSFLSLSRVARFFSIVPLLVYLYVYFLDQITRGRDRYFILGLIFGIMLNYHYSVLMLLPFTLTIALIRKMLIFKGIVKFIIGVLIPLIPLLVHDLAHRMDMTSHLVLWIPYRIAGFLGLYPKNTISEKVVSESSVIFFDYLKFSILPDNQILLGTLFSCVILIFFLFKVFQTVKIKSYSSIYLFVFVWFIWGFFALFIHGLAPIHYYVSLLPIPIILPALLLDEIWKNGFKYVSILILIVITVINLNFFFSKSWFYQTTNKANMANIPYELQISVVKKIVGDARGARYKLKRVGPLDFFEKEYSQNYAFLLWLYGNEPTKNTKLTYVIVEESYPYGASKSAKMVDQISNIAIYKEVNK